jgi:hypothetical protein
MVYSPPVPGPPAWPDRPSRWARSLIPRWLLAGAVLTLVVITVLAGLAGRPSAAQRATDLRRFVHDMTYDVQSCAGGVGEALNAVRASTGDRATAIDEARYGAANCSPANNELLGNLAQYQVTESLASFRLQRVVTGLVDWAAPDAQQVQADAAEVLAARSPAARSRAAAALRRAVFRLDAQRAAVDSVIASASAALGTHVAPPPLPG